MKRIAVISFNDNDVKTGLEALIVKHPDATLLIPVTPFRNFVTSAVEAAKNAKAKFILYFSETDEYTDNLILYADDICLCQSPLREILREVNAEDVFAIAMDDTIESHMALHTVEDYGIECWDISDGLNVIEMEPTDSDVLYEEMQEAMSVFVEALTAYMSAGIMDSISKTIEALMRAQFDPQFPEEE